MDANQSTRAQSVLTGTLLLVDDDQLACGIMRRIIWRAFPHLNVIVAFDGDGALDLLDEDVVCVVSDINMPSRDGLQLCWTIRNTAPYRPWQHIPIVLVSGALSDSAMDRAWWMGIAHVVRKPFSPPEIERAVLQAVASGRPALRSQELAGPPPTFSAKELAGPGRPFLALPSATTRRRVSFG